jgi:hypothetical protein
MYSLHIIFVVNQTKISVQVSCWNAKNSSSLLNSSQDQHRIGVDKLHFVKTRTTNVIMLQ